MDCPLTPGSAVAIAAVLDAHPRKLPHWADWSRDLRAWAASQPVEDHEVLAAEARQEAYETEMQAAGRPVAPEVDVVDLVGALRQSVEAAKARRAAAERAR